MQSRTQTGIADAVDQYDVGHVQRDVRHVGYSLKKSQLPEVVSFNSVWDKKFKMTEQHRP
jgi:hypothetical protein